MVNGTPTRTLIHSVDIVESGGRQPNAWALLDQHGVVATGQTTPWHDLARPGVRVVDARQLAGEGAVLTPGFIDLHGHGGAGRAYDEGADAIRAARAAHRRRTASSLRRARRRRPPRRRTAHCEHSPPTSPHFQSGWPLSRIKKSSADSPG